jgi:hypothetical protein
MLNYMYVPHSIHPPDRGLAPTRASLLGYEVNSVTHQNTVWINYSLLIATASGIMEGKLLE